MNKHELTILCDILRLARDGLYEIIGRGKIENIKDVQIINTMRAINNTILDFDAIINELSEESKK